MIVLIPAYEPDQRLLDLAMQIKAESCFDIIIIDDGSGPAYRGIFDRAESLGCVVLRHEFNKGKGSALKTGFKAVMQTDESDGVICADCDGQHSVKDIIRTADQVKTHKGQIVLGSRRFSGKVPLRSRLGNWATRMIFSFVTGADVFDTQTGLRGYSIDMLDWLCSIPGERFEYEMNMLLEAPSAGYPFHQVEIDTIYLKKNKSSHFHALKDSIRVGLPIITFSASSILSALLDFSLLLLIRHLTGSLFFSVAGSRICSSIFNYTINRSFVFSKHSPCRIKESLWKYFTLVIMIMLLNYGLMHVMVENWGIPLVPSKLLTEAALFLLSYWSQRKFVFKTGASSDFTNTSL